MQVQPGGSPPATPKPRVDLLAAPALPQSFRDSFEDEAITRLHKPDVVWRLGRLDPKRGMLVGGGVGLIVVFLVMALGSYLAGTRRASTTTVSGASLPTLNPAPVPARPQAALRPASTIAPATPPAPTVVTVPTPVAELPAPPVVAAAVLPSVASDEAPTASGAVRHRHHHHHHHRPRGD